MYGNGAALAFGQVSTGFSTAGGNSRFNHTQSQYYAFSGMATIEASFSSSARRPSTLRHQHRPAALRARAGDRHCHDLRAAACRQTLWLRYAANGNWDASKVVKMAGSGATYSATIPAQVGGTQVSYYVFGSGDVPAIAALDADLMTVTYNNNGGRNYSYAGAAAAGPITVKDARAMWLDKGTIAWGGAEGTSYKLLYDPDGGIGADAEATQCTFPAPAGPCFVPLTRDGTVTGYPRTRTRPACRD